MRICFRLSVFLVATLVGGCVLPPQMPVHMDQEVLGPKLGRVGIGSTALPKVDVHLPGAGCLLCYMTASASNSALTTHAQTLPYEDLPKLKDMVADRLRKKGVDVTVISEHINLDSLEDTRSEIPNAARKNYSPLQKKYNIDRLLVIDIKLLGFIRTYSSYFPTSDPKGVLEGAGYIVNLSNNLYEWYLPVNVTRSADKSWYEPPKFPGLSNAYFQVIEVGKDTFLNQFNR